MQDDLGGYISATLDGLLRVKALYMLVYDLVVGPVLVLLICTCVMVVGFS